MDVLVSCGTAEVATQTPVEEPLGLVSWWVDVFVSILGLYAFVPLLVVAVPSDSPFVPNGHSLRRITIDYGMCYSIFGRVYFLSFIAFPTPIPYSSTLSRRV